MYEHDLNPYLPWHHRTSSSDFTIFGVKMSLFFFSSLIIIIFAYLHHPAGDDDANGRWVDNNSLAAAIIIGICMTQTMMGRRNAICRPHLSTPPPFLDNLSLTRVGVVPSLLSTPPPSSLVHPILNLLLSRHPILQPIPHLTIDSCHYPLWRALWGEQITS